MRLLWDMFQTSIKLVLKENGRRKEARQGLIRLRKHYGMEQLVRKMSWAGSVLTDVEKERHNGTDGDWQQQTLCKKSLYLSDTAVTWRFEGVLMRRPYEAAKSGYCEIIWKYCWKMAGSAYG